LQAHPKSFDLVKILAKTLKIRAKSGEIWAKCVKTFAKSIDVLCFFLNGAQNGVQTFLFSGKLGEIWAKMLERRLVVQNLKMA